MTPARTALLSLASLVVALGLAGCASPANFAGAYSVAATNGPNDCGFSGWTAGTMSSGTPVTITQATGSSSASVMIGGTAGIGLALLSGSATVSGNVSGNTATFSAPGSTSGSSGACHYFVTTDIDAHLSGDTLTGTVTLTPVTNHDASCGVLDTCHNTISFAGARPPTT